MEIPTYVIAITISIIFFLGGAVASYILETIEDMKGENENK
tara:strand:- start:168 stop:290 length:123 start_codon:yes stop_codon:yes gene_type:complete